jgi:hypothetical protein
MYDVVEKISEALNVDIWFDWEDDYIILRMWRIRPDDEDEDWVFSHSLTCTIPASADSLRSLDEDDFDFEPEALADLRDDWRSFNERFSRYWLEDVLPAFWENELLSKEGA